MIIYHHFQSVDQNLLHQIFEYRDGEFYWRISPTPSVKKGSVAGCVSSHGYKIIRVNSKNYYAHRLVFMYHYNFVPKLLDHIDNDKLNNRIENLREATEIQNAHNKKINNNNTSGAKNVHWVKSRKKWVANSGVAGKTKFIGYFDDKEKAVEAVKQFREKNHGEFVNHG